MNKRLLFIKEFILMWYDFTIYLWRYYKYNYCVKYKLPFKTNSTLSKRELKKQNSFKIKYYELIFLKEKTWKIY